MEGSASGDEIRSEIESQSLAGPPAVVPQEQPSGAAGEGVGGSQLGQEEKGEGEDENEVLIGKAQGLMDKITANAENPSPSILHALSSILETQEAR